MARERSWFAKWVVFLVLAFGVAAARADKPAKIPVAMGSWTGPHAGRFKSAVRSGVAKDCVVTRADKARAVIDGEVTAAEDGKHFTVRVIVKSPKTNDIVESREYSFNKPEPSQGMTHKMGREVAEIARRAPE